MSTTSVLKRWLSPSERVRRSERIFWPTGQSS
jgi:hypothetical protein